MGGAVSSGRDNNELVDNLMSGNYIRTKPVERVFRALDRADYMTPEARDQAYKDLAWRNGPLHLSSPCIYSEVMEGLELKPGLSFLNVGSGTGYLSTLAGLIIGTSGISHGVEVHPAVVEYAITKIGQFLEHSPVLDDFDFCEPKYYQGNGLCLAPLLSCYDRVYVGAGCPEDYEDYFKKLIKVGGVLVMPLNDTLLQVKRVADDKWVTRSLLNVSFSKLKVPSKEEAAQHVKLDKQTPVRLQLLSRSVVRAAMRLGVIRRNPELREKPRAPPPPAYPRRICIPIEPGNAENLNVHDLDTENGANEMNALLSLVISMGHNRVAGALRFDRIADSASDSSDDEDENREREPRRLEDGTQSDGQSEEPRSDNDSTRPANDSSNSGNDKTRPRNDNPGDSNTDNRGGGNSDSDDDKPNDRPMNRRSETRTLIRQTRRHRRLLEGLDDPRLPASYRELLSYRYELTEPSTSSEDNKTSASGDLTDTSEPKSGESTEDSAGCSKEPRSRPSGIPSEVEIDLGVKMMQQASTSQMDWEANQTDTQEVSDDDLDNSKCKAKRQKLDSGVGEITPSGSSTDKSKTESDSEQSLSHTEETGSHNSVTPRGALLPASQGGATPAAGDGTATGSGPRDPRDEECPRLRAHMEWRRRRIARGGDARRVRLSVLMKQAVRELPLPHALKKFVNLGRCFEF